MTVQAGRVHALEIHSCVTRRRRDERTAFEDNGEWFAVLDEFPFYTMAGFVGRVVIFSVG